MRWVNEVNVISKGNNMSAIWFTRFMKKKESDEPDMSYPNIKAICPSGSRVICDPPVLDTDDDKFVLVDRLPSKARMEADGWELCGSEEYIQHGRLVAYRRGDQNRIFVTSAEYYVRIYAATLLAKEMNLREKKDRVALFATVVDGKSFYGTTPTKGLL